MPFTAAHPALILPLQRLHSKWLSTTGLIVGSIAPDFAYFLPLYKLSSLSHSLKGLLLFNLPMAFVLAILFHWLIRDHVVRNLPAYLRAKAESITPVTIQQLLGTLPVFVISALIGSFSHLFWDSFTHYTGYFVRNYDFLMQPVSLGFVELPLCRVLQHFSTFAGFCLIGWHITTLPSAPLNTEKHWLSWLAYWVLIGFIGAFIMLLNLPAHFHLSRLEYLVVPYLTGTLFAVILLALVRKLWLLFS